MRNPRRGKKIETFDSLPLDILIDVIAKFAEASPDPLTGVAGLRTTCKMLYAASKSKAIFKGIVMRKHLSLFWWHKKRFFSWLQDCARIGNLDANYVLGLEEIYNWDMEGEGLSHLSKAMAGGHQLATYTLGMIKFHHKSTREVGVDLLSKLEVSVGLDGVLALRKEAAAVVRTITMNKWEANPNLCINRHIICRKEMRREGTFDWFNEETQSFCSPECRWNHEYIKFFQMVLTMQINEIIF